MSVVLLGGDQAEINELENTGNNPAVSTTFLHKNLLLVENIINLQENYSAQIYSVYLNILLYLKYLPY